jgi:bifunctional DNase/RNase
MQRRGVDPPRPLSHDLMQHLLEATGIRVEQATITRVEGQIYYASITLRRPRGRAVEVDARPSDAINLALRTKAPILVAEELLDRSGYAGEMPDSLRLPCRGVLEVLNEYGFLRLDPQRRPRADDLYVSAAHIRRLGLRTGDVLAGERRPPVGSEQYCRLTRIDTVNGEDPESVRRQRESDSGDAAPA